MPVSTNLKRDLFALGLLALVVFLGAALVTYDPADPVVEPVAPLNLLYQPDQLVTPANGHVHNVCGRWGAMAADMLLSACGLAAWYVVASPSQCDIIELTMLEGQSGPRLESRIGFEVDGLELKCAHDVAAKVLDWRGLYKNVGET